MFRIEIMTCPNCKTTDLKKEIFCGTEVDYCPKCLGLWFDRDELRQAKDEKDKNLNWLDIDLWQDKGKFRISEGEKLCPKCAMPLYEVNYGDSKVKVDLCNLCFGIWLERGEFRKIINYLRKRGKYEISQNYFKNLVEEASEVFSGPETFREELADFLTVLKLLTYKFASQHPIISKIISMLPR